MKKVIYSKEEDYFLQSKDEYKAYLNAGKLKPSTIGIMEGVKVSLYDDPENYYPLIIPVKKRASNRKAVPDNVSNSCKGIMQKNNEVKPENKNESSIQYPNYIMDYRDYSSFSTIIDFKHPYRKILMAIKTKPFVLLAGISGTGKSRIARTIAYQTCPANLRTVSNSPGNFLLIQVQSNWHEATEIIGYPTQIKGKLEYRPTPFIKHLVKAWCYQDVPFILCLDEMNLAPVERYFSHYLSILESRKYIGKKLCTDAFITAAEIGMYVERSDAFWDTIALPSSYSNIREQFLTEGITLPPNLIVIGTVNIDETTHTFSNKVLDRAMTIEMNDIDMYSGLESKTSHWDYPDEPIKPSHLLSSQITGHEAYADRPDIGNKVIPELQKINHILCDSKFRFGYRVRDEILLYCKHNADLIAENNDKYEWLYSCLDEAIFMKIIPRIFGSTSNCGNVLKELVDYTRNKYNQTNERLCRMLGRLESSGYTHFW
ncbi:McrB family protein [Chitinophaga tropicalis]|uniref:AAA domain-containing protein n=1 Tax=Chitinophaga tropicalis TaxID=2683588 RepID=A0A7K1UEN5_9BACT|nr:AAA family ATPase [Chitinophaga tropicalis]MVT12435.1 AAA domain-containing protein [Chitinophaga tropicalis]